jgi:hypothetical protein
MFLKYTLPRNRDDAEYESLAKDIESGFYRFDPGFDPVPVPYGYGPRYYGY